MDLKNLLGWTTPLHLACKSGSMPAVQRCLDVGADVFALDSDGQTALHLAAKKGDHWVVKMLLVSDEQARVPTPGSGEISMHVEVLSNIRRQLGKLTNNFQVRSPLKALHDSANIEMTQRLIKVMECVGTVTSPQVQIRDKKGRTALHQVLETWDSPKTIRLLVESGADINARDNRGRPALALQHARRVLAWAVRNCHQRTIELLLDQGVDGERGGPDFGQRTLAWTAVETNVVTLHWLLREGVNLRTDKGACALIWITTWGGMREVDWMITHGADVNAESKGITALSVAARLRYWTTMLGLIDHGANVDIDVKGTTLMLYLLETCQCVNCRQCYELKNGRGGCDCGTMDEVYQLIEIVLDRTQGGYFVNAADEHGNTALHLAARLGSWIMVESLVEKGASTESRNRRGLTARDCIQDEWEKEDYDDAVERGWVSQLVGLEDEEPEWETWSMDVRGDESSSE